MRKGKKNWKETDHEGMADYTKQALGDIQFDLEGSYEDGEHPEVAIYKKMLEEATAKLIRYEKFLNDKNLMQECDEMYISDEEIICLQGIETIKHLVVTKTFTKDDINAFDILHRNLCTIRGIKLDKQSKSKKDLPKTRAELLKFVNQK